MMWGLVSADLRTDKLHRIKNKYAPLLCTDLNVSGSVMYSSPVELLQCKSRVEGIGSDGLTLWTLRTASIKSTGGIREKSES